MAATSEARSPDIVREFNNGVFNKRDYDKLAVVA